MPEAAARGAGGRVGPAAILLAVLLALALLAPVLATDQPLVASLDGRLVFPAAADLASLGWMADGPARPIDWQTPPPGARVLLRAPIPHSYRGISLQEALQAPSRRHWLGTDGLGRDMLSRLLHGARPSLLIAFAATGLALAAGGALGGAAALRGGIVDRIVVRLIEIVACFPPFVLVLAFAAAGRGGMLPIVCGIALNRWTGTARYVRGEVLRHRAGGLWDAARASGASLPRVALRHLLPLLAPPLAVLTAFGVAHAVLLESGLSFIGLGVPPPLPSWGTLLAESRATLGAAWWPVAWPAAALVLVLGALGSAAERAVAGRETGR